MARFLSAKQMRFAHALVVEGNTSLLDSAAKALQSHATLLDFDLRGARIARIEAVANLVGATISTEQLLDLAPSLADELGINLG